MPTAHSADSRPAHSAAANDDVLLEDSPRRLEYLRVASNTQRLFGIARTSEQKDFYERFVRNKHLVLDDCIRFAQLWNGGKVNVLGREHVGQGPAFYCSFHLGSFMLINFALAKLGVRFSYVSSAGSVVKKDRYFEAAVAAGFDNPEAEVKVLIGDTRAGLLAISRRARAGESFFSFLDVGVGLGDIGESRNSVEVRLNGQAVLARMGLPFLAHRVGIPVVPVYSWRENGAVFIEFCPPIRGEGTDVRQSARRTTQMLWALFQTRLNCHPDQWESLHTIQQFYPRTGAHVSLRPANPDDARYGFNEERYALLMQEGEHYLFDRSAFETLKVSAKVYAFLRTIHERTLRLSPSELEHLVPAEEFRNSLLERGVLRTQSTQGVPPHPQRAL